MSITFRPIYKPLHEVNSEFIVKYSGNADLTNPAKCNAIAERYLNICVAHLKSNKPIPSDLNFFYERANMHFKNEVNQLLRAFCIEFEDISNGRSDLTRRLLQN